MLAIQNQISVLSKILETKVQHQKIIEYQQAVSASLNKISSPIPTRSRRISSNHDSSSQCGSLKDKKPSNLDASDKLNEVNTSSSGVKENTNESRDNTVIQETTGCVIT